jgi:hypothetical protein
MLDLDQLPAAVDTLQRDRDRLSQDAERLRREFDQLNSKLRYPGTRFLVDLEYSLVFDTTVTAALSTTTTTLVEIVPGAQLATYRVAALPLETGVIVLTDGGGASPVNGIALRLGHELLAGPTRTQTTLLATNVLAANHTVRVKIWRRMGMG